MTDVDEAVAEYRRGLKAKARLAESDLDELEDHMRELIDDLRLSGVPAAAAIRQAAERLGDPHAVAREHACARSTFGAPLSATRAIVAAVLFGVPAVWWCFQMARLPDVSVRSWAETLVWMFVVVSLAARTPWSRHVVIGLVAHRLAFWLVMPIAVHPLNVLIDLAALALVVPWRRSEHSLVGVGLAFRAWMVFAAGTLTICAHFAASESTLVDACTTGAFVMAVASCIGSVRHAPYDAIAAVMSAFALVLAIGGVVVMPLEVEGAASWRTCAIVVGASGIIAGALALFVGLRSPRVSRVATT